MAQATVEQLATTVGASVERLLSQMKDAGLPHAAADELVSEEDKQTLLAFLKRSHGDSAEAPKKITLKRKQLSTLRTSGAGRRTVNVEVRKKRTYVKRDESESVATDEMVEEQDATLIDDAAVFEAPAVESASETEAPSAVDSAADNAVDEPVAPEP